MSQNKTIIQGQYAPQRDGAGQTAQSADPLDSIYKPTGSQPDAMPTMQHTVVTGMYEENAKPEPQKEDETQSDSQPSSAANPTKIENCTVWQQRPIVGILFTVSKQANGEVYPIYLGRNIVGNAENCDIRLREATISAQHAVIVVRRVKTASGERQVASVTDYGSANGTFINGEDIDYDTHVLENHDVLGFGIAYRMAFIMLNPNELHLEVAKHFEALKSQGGSELAQGFNPYAPDRASSSSKTVIY